MKTASLGLLEVMVVLQVDTNDNIDKTDDRPEESGRWQ
jgi:hypothetical protein